MKIGVVGCGAVGSFYGARLGRAGHDVHFLLRSDYAEVVRSGVFIQSPEGDFHFQPGCGRVPSDIGPCDLVVVALKTTANDQLARLITPLMRPDTIALTLQNGLGNEEALARFIAPDQILGGLCFVCLNRVAPGRIQHLAYGKVVLGEFQNGPRPRTGMLAEHFRHAGVRCEVTSDLGQAHWEKLVWNIPFNGLGVAAAAGLAALATGVVNPDAPLEPCLDTAQLLGDAQWSRVVEALMYEVIAAGRAQGFDLADRLVHDQIERTRSMGPYRASTLLDFERGNPLELDALFQRPLREAERAGAQVPQLRTLWQVLTQLMARRERRAAASPSTIC